MSGTPLNTSSPSKRKAGCAAISSACVIWQGNDIPCIDLCKGDAIDEVVYKLALELCALKELTNISELDFDCLVGDGESNPEDLKELLQALIYKACIGGGSGDPAPFSVMSVESESGSDLISLPTCLQYNDSEGDPVTSLPVNEYALLLANRICTLITQISAINSTINVLTGRITTLERAVTNLSTNKTTVITVKPTCTALGGETGLVPIETAFMYLEAEFCRVRSTIGSAESVATVTALQTPNIGTLPSLSDPEATLSDNSSWKENPASVSDSLGNLWIAFSDLHDAYKTTVESATIAPCILIPPARLTVNALTTSSATVAITDTASVGAQTATGYILEVKAWNGTAETGSVLYTQTVPFTQKSIAVSSPLINATSEYIVKVRTIYACGTSEQTVVVGKLKLPVYSSFLKVTLGDPVIAGTSTCTPSGEEAIDIDKLTRQLTLTLRNLADTANVFNTTGSAITVVIRLKKTGCSSTGTTYRDIPVTIANDAGSATYTFTSTELVTCGTGCATEVTTFECIKSISWSVVRNNNVCPAI